MLADGLANNHSYRTQEVPKKPYLGYEQPKGKLLLVDDNMTNCYLTQLHLNAQGFDVEIATDGRQAIEKVRQDKFDLILMDISMPDMDGIEATKRIRELEQGVDLPIIAFSAFNDVEKQFNLKEIGISNILHKPAEISEIKNIIKQYV
jgi:CheY-like chemotaxis protein